MKQAQWRTVELIFGAQKAKIMGLSSLWRGSSAGESEGLITLRSAVQVRPPLPSIRAVFATYVAPMDYFDSPGLPRFEYSLLDGFL